MHLFINVFGRSIPSYGLLITTGVIIANLVAMYVLKRTGLDFDDFVILESFCMLGAFVGAKLLYIIVSYKYINWSRITELDYLNGIMQGGFVFYGGLIGGILAIYIAGKFQKIQVEPYIRNFIFLIPFIHCFGRIGCFMAGCCYGIPYHGIGAVVFPEMSFAIPGVELFPVQIVEAAVLLIITGILLYLQLKKEFYYTIELYIILYGTARFFLEYLRYDAVRGAFWGLSTSQWISIALILTAVASILRHELKENRVVQ